MISLSKSKKQTITIALGVLTSLAPGAFAKRPQNLQHATPPAPQISNVRLYRAMQARIDNTDGFCGGDAAYSIELDDHHSLWLFGDSFKGHIVDGKRVDCSMVRNCIAIDKHKDKGERLRYYFGDGDFFKSPAGGDQYLWPGDGAMIAGQLYLFMHSLRDDKSLPAPFQFELQNNYVLTVKNPLVPPAQWQWQATDMGSAKDLTLGVSCLKSDDYLYIYSATAKATQSGCNPTVLARIKTGALPVLTKAKLQWWDGHGWQPKQEKAKILFDDGAPEMSVIQHKGLGGFYAVYIPDMGKSIMVRRANAPEGPWSAPQEIYKWTQDAGLIYYSAKAHPQYSKDPDDRELTVTYNVNAIDFKRLMEDSSIYFPRAVRCTLLAP